MYISRLRLYQFRNLIDQEIRLQDGAVFVTGNNGNGKTNLVEALYLLSGSKSFRTSSSTELIKWGGDSCSIFGDVSSKDGDFELGLIFHPGRREGTVNGNTVPSFSEFLSKISVISFTPNDLALVKGPPAGRRKFLDRHMVDKNANFLRSVVSYQRALASKNAVLKDPGAKAEMLDPWNALMAEHAETITKERFLFLEEIQKRCREKHKIYAGGDGELTLALETDFSTGGVDKLPMSKSEIEERLFEVRGRELQYRSAVIGSQKDDVEIKLGGVDARAYASQGQTRSVVLSLKLAVIESVENSLGEPPIVLLDDVDSELDATRASNLFRYLLNRPMQLLVTGTSIPPYLADVSGPFQQLRVTAGAVEIVAE